MHGFRRTFPSAAAGSRWPCTQALHGQTCTTACSGQITGVISFAISIEEPTRCPNVKVQGKKYSAKALFAPVETILVWALSSF